ncbi:MAG TPA: Rrf2 family transcriptional regulator [Streptosporangiaceae bacterium]|nr:Rrf2 family transcriptional regulator [Streptosporangiaceae bacterium]
MRLGEGVEWAAHCTVLLACLPPETTLSAARLAEYHGVPGPYLAKALQALSGAGIIESVSGRHGGYRLARPAQAISLLEVVHAVEGTEQAFRCSEIRRRGPTAVPARSYTPTCSIAAAMWAAEDAWRQQLASVSVAALAETVMATSPAAAMAKATSWLGGAVRQRERSDT